MIPEKNFTMQAFLRVTTSSSLFSLLIFFDVSSGLFIRRGDTGPANEAAFLGTTNAAELALWEPRTGVHYHDVSQGTTGDCWLDSSMASVAYADSDHIGKIMVDDGEHAKVTLWHSSTSTTYEVKKRTINYMTPGYSVASSAVTRSQWVWPACMEDAFRELAKDSSTGIA